MTCSQRAWRGAGVAAVIMAAVAAGGALSGCSHKAADAAPGVTPPAQLPNVAAPTTAPGHVSGAMRAGQQLRQMKSPR